MSQERVPPLPNAWRPRAASSRRLRRHLVEQPSKLCAMRRTRPGPRPVRVLKHLSRARRAASCRYLPPCADNCLGRWRYEFGSPVFASQNDSWSRVGWSMPYCGRSIRLHLCVYQHCRACAQLRRPNFLLGPVFNPTRLRDRVVRYSCWAIATGLTSLVEKDCSGNSRGALVECEDVPPSPLRFSPGLIEFVKAECIISPPGA
jgi:hypothetical protein